MKKKLIYFTIISILLFGINKDNSVGISITGEEEIPKPTVIEFK